MIYMLFAQYLHDENLIIVVVLDIRSMNAYKISCPLYKHINIDAVVVNITGFKFDLRSI